MLEVRAEGTRLERELKAAQAAKQERIREHEWHVAMEETEVTFTMALPVAQLSCTVDTTVSVYACRRNIDDWIEAFRPSESLNLLKAVRRLPHRLCYAYRASVDA